MPKLITDLAIMLLTAAVVAVIFKKIKQPLVLGYILAGFLVGPFMPYFFTVEDSHSIETWSEIGIIILMFSLGLEFNLHKLISVGKTAVVTALVEVFGMLVVGYTLGQLLGWGVMDSIFLGGMLSMSSTTIIIKAFDELKVTKEKFAQLVFGILVIEDIAGIFMMIVLSTISASKNISGLQLGLQLSEMVLYLALWLIIGIFVLPTILRVTKKFMNDEVLLITSLGICFGMVLIAEKLGFSSALGAFLSGSLLAGTVLAEKVEHLTSSIKDLFGAVFFLSVGMMIDPAMLIKYIVPIIIISIVTVVGKLVVSSTGVLLSGQNLSLAVHCGSSLAQIGEFAFIIASLGMSMGVIADYLYPIIVAVSVVTTLTTPFFIKNAGRVESLVEKILPNKLIDMLNSEDDIESDDSEWWNYIKRYVKITLLYGALMTGVAMIARLLIYPLLAGAISNPWIHNTITIAILFVGIGVFVRPMLDLHSSQYTSLWVKDVYNRPPLVALSIMRFVLIVFIAFITLQTIIKIPGIILAALIALAIMIAYKTGWMASTYISAETRFKLNLNERSLKNIGDGDVEFLDEKVFVGKFIASDATKEVIINKTLKQLNWGRRFRVNIFKVVRKNRHIAMPDGDFAIEPRDIFYITGNMEDISSLFFSLGIPLKDKESLPTLRTYIENQTGTESDVYDYAMLIKKGSPLVGKTIKESGIREKYDCMVIGFHRNRLLVLLPDTNTIIEANDLVWVLGTKTMAEKLLKETEY